MALETTEVLTFRIQLAKKKWITISSVYVPQADSKGHDIIKLRTIPSMKSSLLDGRVEPDKRGEDLLEWTFEQQMTILNDGDGTRFDKSTTQYGGRRSFSL